MTTVLLVTESYIRNNTVFNQNVDISDIVNNIGIAQEMNLEPILGSSFYDYIQAAYSAQTLTADETTLVLHIKPFVSYSAAEMALPFIHYQIKNKGISTQSGDFSAPADNTVMHYLKKEITNRKEWYGERLRNYLLLNGSLFSGYTYSNQDINPDKSSVYDSGFAQYPGTGCNNCGGFNGFYNRY